MRLLLDTHVWLWLQTEPEQLGDRTRHLLEDDSSALLMSAASAWEIAIKYAVGRLPLPQPPDQFVPEACRRAGISELPISTAHSLRAGALPAHHKDPFDRLLVAQAQALSVPLVTVDDAIAAYDVEIVRD